MRVVLLMAHLSQHSGGLAASVPGLARALNAMDGVETTILGIRDPLAPDAWRKWGEAVHFADPLGPRRFGFASSLGRQLAKIDPDLVDVQGIWMYHSVVSLWHHRRTGKPYVVTPRGMLDPWAVENAARKKRVARALFEHRHLAGAACLRATSELEARYLRAYGLGNPIAIVPNGIDVREPVEVASGPTVLYFGRLHAKKGLDLLLRAWAHIEANGTDWVLRIVGPDEGGYRRELEALAKELGLRRVIFEGAVYGEDKWRKLASADLFVLPTHSENFGMVVAEALAAGTPVVVTKGAPWSAIEAEGCGWWVEIGVGPMAEALAEALSRDREALAKMGARGRRFVTRKFAWSGIARQMREVYEWVLGGGPPPSCVMTD